MHPESSFQIAPNWLYTRKMAMTSQFSDMTLLPIFFDVVLFLLSSLVTGRSFMSLSLVLELLQFLFIRDWPEIGNTPIWVLPNIWRLGQVKNIKFGTNISNKMLLNAAKCQVTAFTVSELLRENHITPPPLSQPSIRVNKESFSIND